MVEKGKECVTVLYEVSTSHDTGIARKYLIRIRNIQVHISSS